MALINQSVYYREWEGSCDLPSNLRHISKGDLVRSDLLKFLSSDVRTSFKPAIKFEHLGLPRGDKGVDVLVSPLMRRRRRERPSTGLNIKFGPGFEDYAETSALTISESADVKSCEIFPRGVENNQGWVDALYAYRPWNGWDSEDSGGACVVFPGVDPVKCEPPKVGIIVTCFNKPDRVSACIRSILERTDYPNVNVYIVDDGSDEYSRSVIQGFDRDGVKIIRHSNRGYIRSANRGAKDAIEDECEYIVFVNSDVRVTIGWLSGMVRGALRTDAALVNPLSNQQGPISLPLALEKSWGFFRLRGGRGYLDAAVACSFIPPSYPEAITNVGQCLLVRSDEWNRFGPFDGSIYGSGYGEECELWARIVNDGGKGVVADDVYVYHESHATHINADTRERDGAERFMKRWSDLYDQKADLIRLWPDRTRVARNVISSIGPRQCPVRFIMVNIGPYGGVYCALRLVDELNERGFNASAEFVLHQPNDFRLTTGPMRHSGVSELKNLYKSRDNDGGFLVATHWGTAEILDQNARKGSVIPLAFWQDREDMFVDPDGSRPVKGSMVTQYSKIPNRIVNAFWVGDSAMRDLGVDGFNHIPVGVDCNKFYPPDWIMNESNHRGETIRIFSMHRPSTPRRGAGRLRSLYEWAKGKYKGRVQIETFGEDCRWSDFHHGSLSQDRLAELMREADILIEPSEFQGFGLPGLEAMASGMCLVSTDNKGIHEYGVHNRNCLIEGDNSLEELLSMAIDDEGLRMRLRLLGRADALEFDWSKIADKWADTLKRLYSESGMTKFLHSFD